MARVSTLVAELATGFDLTVVDLDPLRAAICAVGELDLAARDALAEVLQEQEDAGRRIVRLDLSHVTFLDCSCLGVLVSSHQRFLELHGLLVLTVTDGSVVRLLEMTGLGESLFVILTDQDLFESVLMARASRSRRVPKQRDRLVAPVFHRSSKM
jgi:anti-anti-sigma factor